MGLQIINWALLKTQIHIKINNINKVLIVYIYDSSEVCQIFGTE